MKSIDEKAGRNHPVFPASVCGLFLTRDVFHDIAGLAIEDRAQSGYRFRGYGFSLTKFLHGRGGYGFAL